MCNLRPESWLHPVLENKNTNRSLLLIINSWWMPKSHIKTITEVIQRLPLELSDWWQKTVELWFCLNCCERGLVGLPKSTKVLGLQNGAKAREPVPEQCLNVLQLSRTKPTAIIHNGGSCVNVLMSVLNRRTHSFLPLHCSGVGGGAAVQEVGLRVCVQASARLLLRRSWAPTGGGSDFEQNDGPLDRTVPAEWRRSRSHRYFETKAHVACGTCDCW